MGRHYTCRWQVLVYGRCSIHLRLVHASWICLRHLISLTRKPNAKVNGRLYTFQFNGMNKRLSSLGLALFKINSPLTTSCFLFDQPNMQSMLLGLNSVVDQLHRQTLRDFRKAAPEHVVRSHVWSCLSQAQPGEVAILFLLLHVGREKIAVPQA